jgi:hypothetical protein
VSKLEHDPLCDCRSCGRFILSAKSAMTVGPRPLFMVPETIANGARTCARPHRVAPMAAARRRAVSARGLGPMLGRPELVMSWVDVELTTVDY